MLDRLRVTTDIAAAYPEVGTVRSAVAARDWARARSVLDAAPPVGRTTLLWAAAERKQIDEFLLQVLRADPTDTGAAAMLAFHHIETGWRIRGEDYARATAKRKMAGFHAKLHEGEQIVATGLQYGPRDPALWVAGITLARGLEMGLPEAERRYGHLHAIDPQHLPGQSQLLQQLTPKWGGSWERAHGFAREMMLGAPEGSHSAALVADAHIEGWFEARTSRRYLTDKVHAEVMEAANRSVHSPSFSRTPGWIQVMNSFAMALVLVREREAAAALFEALGRHATRFPWIYAPDTDPVSAFRRYRAIANGRRRIGLTAADWTASMLLSDRRRNRR
jgi:hypothetical protein